MNTSGTCGEGVPNTEVGWELRLGRRTLVGELRGHLDRVAGGRSLGVACGANGGGVEV